MQNALNNVIAKYSNIEGNYEANVWDGVQHYLTDSGICTDAFSVQDAERVEAAGLYEEDEDGICFAYDNGLEDISEAVKAHDGGLDLDCVLCIKEIEELGYDAAELLETM